ncbi:MAG TPA: VWA domain-containing protein [Pyrinomonadaceae bacterium]|jgi:VWFA-related protein
MRRLHRNLAAALLVALACAPPAPAQRRTDAAGRAEVRRDVRTVTIPVTLRLPKGEPQKEVQYLDDLQIFEDGERQEILAMRGEGRAPLTLAVLIQDDLASSVSNEIRGIADFVRKLPPGSRVMVAYLGSGSLRVRQKFTPDLERAAKSLRIPLSSTAASPYNPFALTRDALKRFESQAVGRRAVLLLSDGVDLSRGYSNSSPAESVDLQRAVDEAQRLGVAVYSVYAPSVVGGEQTLASNGQGALSRLADETGGRAFFNGTQAPVSLSAFLREIDTLLSRQFALTYLSTHPDKGFHKVRVVAGMSEGKIIYPKGYTR